MRNNAADHELVPKAEVLEVHECWALLRQAAVGRLGVLSDGHPDIFPVNYKVENEALVFRTGEGTKLQAIEEGRYVALEADAVSADFGFAWSVVVKGTAAQVDNADNSLNTVSRSLFPWQGVGKDQLIRISPESVTGRRFALTARMRAWTGLDVATRAGLE